MAVRGIRGATTAEADTKAAIIAATKELLEGIVEANGIEAPDLASVFFTLTPDLTATFPAKAARLLGWHDIALLCASETGAKGPGRCIRILIHWNTDRAQSEVRHVYLRGAVSLRPDRAGGSAG